MLLVAAAAPYRAPAGDGEEICNGNRESLGSVLSRDSILVWHVTAFGRARRRMRAWQADPSGPPVLLFRSPAALDRWLAGLPGC